MRMKAGEELDALVDDKVFGTIECDKWYTQRQTTGWGDMIKDCDHARCRPRGSIPKYSTNIATAWTVLKVLAEGRKWDVPIGFQLTKYNDGPYAEFHKGNNNGRPKFNSYGDSFPHAICLAALKAVGVEMVE